jgi:hypothetical protein
LGADDFFANNKTTMATTHKRMPLPMAMRGALGKRDLGVAPWTGFGDLDLRFGGTSRGATDLDGGSSKVVG